MNNQQMQVSQSVTNKGVIMPPRLRAALRAEREGTIKVSIAPDVERVLTIFNTGIEGTMDLVNAAIETCYYRFKRYPFQVNLSTIHWLALGGRRITIERYGRQITLGYGGPGPYDVQCSVWA